MQLTKAYTYTGLRTVTDVQVCDATRLNSTTNAGYIKNSYLREEVNKQGCFVFVLFIFHPLPLPKF